MYWDEIGKCYCANTIEEIKNDGWEILDIEDWKHRVKRCHICKLYDDSVIIRLVYVPEQLPFWEEKIR